MVKDFINPKKVKPKVPFVQNPPLGKWYQRKPSHFLPKRPTVNPLNKLKPNNLSTKVSAF